MALGCTRCPANPGGPHPNRESVLPLGLGGVSHPRSRYHDEELHRPRRRNESDRSKNRRKDLPTQPTSGMPPILRSA